MTVQRLVAAARQELRDAQLSEAEADLGSRLLAQHVLGWTTERFLVDSRSPEPAGFADEYAALVARRAAREPLPYIVGYREFWGLKFEVTPAVLIPRPETELIVDAAVELHQDADAPVEIADIGTGSGCVAIAIAIERPAASIVATDISSVALEVARRNAAAHGVTDRIQLVQADLLDGVSGTFDLIVANPPYVRARDGVALQPEVQQEPSVALFSGPDGLDAIARIVDEAPARLRAGGHLVFEFGFGQDVEIEKLIEASRLSLVRLLRDLQGIARTAVCRAA